MHKGLKIRSFIRLALPVRLAPPVRLALPVLLALLAWHCPLSAGALTLPAEDMVVLETELAAIFDEYHTLGASVALIENGQVTYTYCYGERSDGGEPVTPDSGFQVGSISKLVANIGLMQLVEAGKITLDGELGDTLGFSLRSPYYPDTPVTLRQLMTHTAALRDSKYYNDALAGHVRPLSSLFERDKINYVFQPKVKPGEESIYSNFGGGLIGILIERLTGQTLDSYMAENVFEPMGIAAAYQAWLLPENMPLCDIYYMPQRLLGKRLRDDNVHVTEPDLEQDYFFSAGKLIISAPDLAKLLIVLCDGGVYQNTRLLREDTAKEICTMQSFRGTVRCRVERGLFMNIITDRQVEGRTLYGHGGKAFGMLCAAYFDPADRTGVVMLTNGCQNQRVHEGVGELGWAVLTRMYQALEQSGHELEDPFAVQ